MTDRMTDRTPTTLPEPVASNRSAQDPQKPGQPVRPGPPAEAEDPAEKAKAPKPPEPFTATHEPGNTDDRPDDKGRQQGDKGGL